VVCSHATTLWHFDAAEWAPSTASKGDIPVPLAHFRFTPQSRHRLFISTLEDWTIINELLIAWLVLQAPACAHPSRAGVMSA
jgi:hypothetical protein